jgi:hypothetical protein
MKNNPNWNSPLVASAVTASLAVVAGGLLMQPAVSANITTGDVLIDVDQSVCVNQNQTIIGETFIPGTTPCPTATPQVSPSPDVSPSPGTSPSPTPAVSPSPTVAVSPTPTPQITSSPTPTPSPSPQVSPTPSPSPQALAPLGGPRGGVLGQAQDRPAEFAETGVMSDLAMVVVGLLGLSLTTLGTYRYVTKNG